MLDGLAGYIQRDERNNLNGLMRGNAKGAIGIDMPGWMPVHHLDDSNHQNQRDADNSNHGQPCGTHSQF